MILPQKSSCSTSRGTTAPGVIIAVLPAWGIEKPEKTRRARHDEDISWTERTGNRGTDDGRRSWMCDDPLHDDNARRGPGKHSDGDLQLPDGRGAAPGQPERYYLLRAVSDHPKDRVDHEQRRRKQDGGVRLRGARGRLNGHVDGPCASGAARHEVLVPDGSGPGAGVAECQRILRADRCAADDVQHHHERGWIAHRRVPVLALADRR